MNLIFPSFINIKYLFNYSFYTFFQWKVKSRKGNVRKGKERKGMAWKVKERQGNARLYMAR